MKKNFTDLEREHIKRDLRCAIIALTTVYDLEERIGPLFCNVTVDDLIMSFYNVISKLDQEEKND